MIVIYPMLISQAVSENIIPGISKTIEGYILANAKSAVVDNPDVNRNFNFKIKNKKLVAYENIKLPKDHILYEEDDGPPYGSKEDWNNPYSDMAKEKRAKTQKEYERRKRDQEKRNQTIKDEEQIKADIKQEKEKERQKEIEAIKDEEQIKADIEQEKEKEKEKRQEDRERIEAEKRATTKVTIQDNRAISIEPSLIELDIIEKNGNIKHEVIGVKIVPLRVKSDVKLSRLILHDTQVSFISSKVLGFGRSMTRLIYKLFDKVITKFRGAVTLSGDPRHDIIMGRSGFKGEGFVVLSKDEDIDEIFLSNISKLNRLFKMGWNNIIVVDDIQRQVHFCMKIFKGTCTTLSFSTIYQNLNHLGVYESLEDAKRKTSMIFKIGKKAKNVFSECIIQNKISKYLNKEKYNND